MRSPTELDRGRWVIAACVLGSGIAALDATVVGIALPAVGRIFDVGVGTLQWVVTDTRSTLAAFLLLGGSLGDRFGRRRVFVIGVIWFAVASAGCGLAPTPPLLIAARLVQGVGGALLVPASLAILERSFRLEDRSRAIGAWSGLGGLATAAGPLVGGYLIAAGSWRWVFFINLPGGRRRHRPHRPPRARVLRPERRRTDRRPGAAPGRRGLAGLTYGLIEGPTAGWSSPGVVVGLAVAVGGRPGLLPRRAVAAQPHAAPRPVPPRQFSAANAVTFIVYGALAGALFLLPVELQVVTDYSALEAGLSLLPMTAIMLVFSARSGSAGGRIGPRLQMSLGPIIVGVGLVLLTRATARGDYLTWSSRRSSSSAPGWPSRSPADGHGHGLGAGRAGRGRLGGQQRRGPRRRAHHGGGAARRRRDPGPSPPRTWRPVSAPPC